MPNDFVYNCLVNTMKVYTMPAKHTLKNGGYEVDLLVDDTVSNKAGHDAFRLVGSDNTLINPRCNDLRCRLSAHCDFIQEYPVGLEPNAQFMGAIAYNNIVDGGELNANGSMQGYFFGDGGKVGGVVKNLTIQTESRHKFSIYGALNDNTFENIKNKDGSLITLFFDDMRIGGGHPLAFFVSSFKDHSYEPINTNNPIDDRRGKKWQNNKKYVDNFDLYLWREISEHFRHEYADAPKEQRFDIHFRKVLAEYERVTELNMKLSPNFTLEEMTRSQTASRHGIDNTPDQEEISNLRRLADFLEKIRAGQKGAVFISSGFRSYTLNKAIGGASKSAHMKGLAADIKVQGKTSRETALWISENLPGEYDTNILEFGRWVHIAIADKSKSPRSRDLTAIKRDGRTIYLKGIR